MVVLIIMVQLERQVTHHQHHQAKVMRAVMDTPLAVVTSPQEVAVVLVLLVVIILELLEVQVEQGQRTALQAQASHTLAAVVERLVPQEVLEEQEVAVLGLAHLLMEQVWLGLPIQEVVEAGRPLLRRPTLVVQES